MSDRFRRDEVGIDPFGLGLNACFTGHQRSTCPFPSAYFEAGSWLAGWDRGFTLRDQSSHVVEFRRLSRRVKPKSWRGTEMVVLRYLATRGESLSSLAARFSCSASSILDECERQAIRLSEEQRAT